MKTRFKQFLISIAFLSIFAVKMGISVAPVVFYLDKEVVLSVILQLELENHSKDGGLDTSKDLLKAFSKASNCSLIDLHPILPFNLKNLSKYHTNANRYIASFYPSVPTPPP